MKEDLVARLNRYSAEKQFHGGITAEAADAIEELLSEIERYRHAAFVIGETCVDASKQHITPEAALQKIRKNIYYTRHE